MTVSHPKPQILARNLRQLADRLDDKGDLAIRQAVVLAARGWPTSTNGSDGSRSSDATSSTERAGLNPGPYDDIDARLARQLRLLWATTVQIHATLDQVAAHECQDRDCPVCADTIPAGTGTCLRCERLVRPTTKRPHDRIQAGYCPACYRRWVRLGRPDRSTYTRTNNEDTAA